MNNVHISTGWTRLIRYLKLQVIFRNRATNFRALLRKMTYEDKASHAVSSPPCTNLQCHVGGTSTSIQAREFPKGSLVLTVLCKMAIVMTCENIFPESQTGRGWCWVDRLLDHCGGDRGYTTLRQEPWRQSTHASRWIFSKVSSEEPYKSPKEPCITTKEPNISTKEPYILGLCCLFWRAVLPIYSCAYLDIPKVRSKEHYKSPKEPCISTKDPYTSTSEALHTGPVERWGAGVEYHFQEI